MAAIASLASSWGLEGGSLERTVTAARADREEEAGCAAAEGLRGSGAAAWCTLRRGEEGEDAPCHVAVLFRGQGTRVLGLSVTSSARFVECYAIAEDCGTPQAALGRTHDYLCTLRCSAAAPPPAPQPCGRSTSSSDTNNGYLSSRGVFGSDGALGPSGGLPLAAESREQGPAGPLREVKWMQGSAEMSEGGGEGEEGGKEARGLLLKLLGVPSPKDTVQILQVQVRLLWDSRDSTGEPDEKTADSEAVGAETTRGAGPMQTPSEAPRPMQGELSGTPGMPPGMLPLLLQAQLMGGGMPGASPSGVPGAATGSTRGLPQGLGPMAMLLQQAQLMGVPGATGRGIPGGVPGSAKAGDGDTEGGRGRGEVEPLTKAASAAQALAAPLMGKASHRPTQPAQGQTQQSQSQPQPQSQPQLQSEPSEAGAQQAQMLLQMQRLLAAGPVPGGTAPGPGGAGEESCKENLDFAGGDLGALRGAFLAAVSQSQGHRGGGTTLAEGHTRANQQATPGADRPVGEGTSPSLCPGVADLSSPGGMSQGGGAVVGAPGGVLGAELVRRMDAQEQRVESLLSSFAATAASLERSMAQLSARMASLESRLPVKEHLNGGSTECAGSEGIVEAAAGVSSAVKIENGVQGSLG